MNLPVIIVRETLEGTFVATDSTDKTHRVVGDDELSIVMLACTNFGAFVRRMPIITLKRAVH